MCDDPIFVDNDGPEAWRHVDRRIPVPCGRCAPCQSRRINQWVFRLCQEDRVSTSSFFVTLTYDNWSVPISDRGYMTLLKSDFQKYMKRLRVLHSDFDVSLKYYACGEYGSTSWRPHYHIILFNAVESLIPEAWTLNDVSIGHVDVGTVTPASMTYCAKYIHKPYRIPVHVNDDRHKEFSVMSKGLGKSYITAATIKYHRSDLTRNFVVSSGGFKVAMPRYYRDRIYSKSEISLQNLLIVSAVEEKALVDRKRFDKLYGSRMDYDLYLEYCKHGRFLNHFSNFKNDLL